jgi:hypothetical protein
MIGASRAIFFIQPYRILTRFGTYQIIYRFDYESIQNLVIPNMVQHLVPILVPMLVPILVPI